MNATTDGYLNFNTKINLNGFDTGIKSIEKSFNTLKSTVTSVAAAMGLATGAKAMIESAAEVNAQTSQLEQTFGTLEKTALNAMQRVADASGILETRLRATGTQIYAFAKTSGMDSVQALTMMEDALQIAADSAAYYDRSLEDVSATLQSFLKGNYSNDAALGLSATEATRNAKAMALYGKFFQDLTEAQKQLALLDMVRDANRLSGAMGQAAREADGWENVLGNLKEAWRQLLAVVGQPALHLAIDTVKLMTSAITDLTAKARIAVNTLNQLFGWEESNANAVTASIEASTDQQNALTDAVEETAKAQETMLAGFDKITKLGGDDEESSSAQNVTPTVNTQQLIPEVEEAAEESADVFAKAFELAAPIQNAWDEYGDDLTASAQRTAEELKEQFQSVGESLRNVWTNGTGENITGSALRTFTNLSDIVGNLSERFTLSWRDDGTGDKIIQNAADHLLILLGTIENVSKATADWSGTLNFSPMLSSFSGLQESLTPILDEIGGLISWVWENALLPLAGWTIEDAVPAALDVLSGALDVLSAAVEALEPYGMWLWDEFISPLADWTGEIVITGLEGLASVLHDIGDWINEHPDAAVTIGGLTAAFLGLYTILSGGLIATATTNVGAFLATLGALDVTIGIIVAGIVAWGYVITELHDNWDDIMLAIDESGGIFGFLAGWLEDVREDVEEFFDFGDFGHKWRVFWEWVGGVVYTAVENTGKTFTLAKDLFIKKLDKIKWWFTITKNYITEKIEAFPGFIQDKIQTAYDNTIKPFEKIGEWAFDRVEEIKAPFKSIADWFKDIFSTAWQNVLDVFSAGGTVFEGIEAGISSVFTQTVNSIIDGINNTLTLPFWNIKEALRVLREWEFAGMNPFYWMPDIDLPKIPRLAQGTVVPANYGEFLAVLGDNKREAEIVSPISKMEQAVENVMRRMDFGGDLNLTLELDGKPIYKDVIKRNNQCIRMTGKNPLNPTPKGVTT